MFNRWINCRVLGIFLGNLFEHYDTALYALLSPFLAPLFFPHYDAITALMMTYAIIPLGMVARPIGALFFGFIGDLYGRLPALYGSLLGMGLATTMIALLPTYEDIGPYAPLLLLFARICQNFFGAGEVVGGAVYILEEGEEETHDMMSSLFGASTVGGALFASALVALLAYFGVVEEGWRFLYLLGAVTAICVLFLRRGGNFSSVDKNLSLSLKGYVSRVRGEWRPALQIMVVAGFSYACYSVALVVVNGLVPLITPIDSAHIMVLNTFLLGLDFILLPLIGLLALRFGRNKIMYISALAAVIAGAPLFFLLEGASYLTVALVRICFVVIGVGFSATFFSWAQTLVSKECRYLVISLSYALGAQLLGAPTATVTLAIFKATGSVPMAALYWCFLGALASGVLLPHYLNSPKAVNQV